MGKTIPSWQNQYDSEGEFVRPRAGQTTTAPPTQPPTTQHPPGTVGLTAGYTPNYMDLILHDPAYLAWQNNSQRDLDQAAAARKAALQALVVHYGGLGGFQDAYGDIDQTTLDLAAKNEFSDVRRLQRNYQQGVEQFKRGLAARGGLGSGELQYGLDQTDLARASSEYDLGQQFMNAARGAIASYLGVEAAERAQGVDALRAAEQSVYSNPLNRPVEGTSATLEPDWETKYGFPVYRGPDGKLYRLGPDGNPVEFTPGENPPPTGGGSSGSTAPPEESDPLERVFRPYRPLHPFLG